ncbi:MAG: hypothetical protein IKC83_05125 [Clostridia bacterium]|nr:hypothetical protein [Clostridia bacterium]
MKKSKLFLLMIATLCLIAMVSGVAMATGLTVDTFDSVWIGEYSSTLANNGSITKNEEAVIVFGELSGEPAGSDEFGAIVTYPDGVKKKYVAANRNGLKFGIAIYGLEEGLYSFNTYVGEEVGDEVELALGGHKVTISVDGEVKSVQYVEDGENAVLPDAEEGYDILWNATGKNVTADIEIEGTTYEVVDKTVLGSVADVDLSLDVENYEFALADVDESLTDNSKIVAVSCDGVFAQFGLDGTDAFTVSKAQMNYIDRGERVAKVYMNDGKVYAFTITLITDVIETASDFSALIESVATAPVEDEDNVFPIFEGEYYVLGGNITMDTNTPIASISWQKSFAGVLDGRGYAINDLNATSSGGIFRELRGTVKNISLINIKAAYGTNEQIHNEQAGFICKSLNGGTIENVYIEGVKAMYSWGNGIGGIVDDMYAGTIRNTIQKVTYRYNCSGSPQAAVGSSTIARIIANGEESTVENNIYIGGTSAVVAPNVPSEGWTNNEIYASEELAIAGQDFASFTAPWIVEEGKLPVLKGSYVAVLGGEGYFAVGESGTSKLDFGSTGVDASEVTKIAKIVGGVETELAISGEDGIYLDKSALAVGENTLKVYTADGASFIKVIGADMVIANTTDMDNLYSQIASGKNQAGKYIVLSANVVYAEGTVVSSNSGWDNSFNGTFDGRGYGIYNAILQGGMFRRIVGATIKNIALVNVDSNYGIGASAANEQSGFVAKEMDGGLIENVYVQGKHFINWNGDVGGIIDYMSAGTIRNTVSNLTYYYNEGAVNYPASAPATACVIGRVENGTIAQNNYSIGAKKVASISPESGWANNYFADSETALFENATYDFSSFNEFWVVEEGKLPVFKSLAK